LIYTENSIGDFFNLDDLWKDFKEFNSPSKFGVYNWVGDYYPNNSFPVLPKNDWDLISSPSNLIGDGFRASLLEWFAFCLSVKFSINKTVAPFNCLEFGASQGLWCLPWSRIMSSLNPTTPLSTYSLALEATNSLNETIEFWNENFLDRSKFQSRVDRNNNTFIFQNETFKFEWLQRCISNRRFYSRFPNVNVTQDNGANRISNFFAILSFYKKSSIKVRNISFKDVFDKFSQINFLHIDIQGQELDLFKHRLIRGIQDKVKVLVLGTHSREIEEKAIKILGNSNLVLFAENSCRYSYVDKKIKLISDGEQIWISPEVNSYIHDSKYIKKNHSL
jgi:hypothetical protein